jgi:hypothetical protein
MAKMTSVVLSSRGILWVSIEDKDDGKWKAVEE